MRLDNDSHLSPSPCARLTSASCPRRGEGICPEHEVPDGIPATFRAECCAHIQLCQRLEAVHLTLKTGGQRPHSPESYIALLACLLGFAIAPIGSLPLPHHPQHVRNMVRLAGRQRRYVRTQL